MSLRNLDRHARRLRERVRELEVPEDLDQRFGPYRHDPVGFVEEVLGVVAEPYQREVLAACAEEPRVAWRAAHGVGKTAVLSWVLLWWLLTRPFSRVLVVAPAFERQVGRYLLPEVRRWCRRAPEELPVEVRANTVEVQGYGREWFAMGVQASDPDKIEGAHHSVAVLADEAKGLPADVVAALHGSQTDRSGDRLYVLASVPGGPSGPFYDAHRSGVWRTFHTAAGDSSLVDPAWIEERAAEWGTGSPLYVARVLGEFPEEDEGTLIRLSDLEAAVGRELEPEEAEEGEEPAVTFGVDPARYGGDRTALAVWRGMELERVEARQGLSTMEVASWIASEINRRKPSRVRVDSIGIGSGVVDRLGQLDHRVEGVNVGSRAERPELHANVRAEVFWRLREALERGEVCLPDHEALLAELSALRYEYTNRGKIQLEQKNQTRKRVGRSPDLADAVALGFTGGERKLDPTGKDAITMGGYLLEEARAEGLLEDDGEWVEAFRLPPSPGW